MLRKTLLALSASMLLGTAVIIPNAAHAQLLGPPPIGPGGPPPGGPPPGLAAGGPPLGGPPPAHSFGGPFGRLGAGPFHGGADAPPRFSHVDGAPGVRGVALAARSDLHGYANHDYGHGGWRHGYRGSYGAYDSDSYAQADGCYYVSAYRRYGYQRILVCSSN
jgi:hypothetical protein